MIKRFISVEIVDHKLVGMPHMLSVCGTPSHSPTRTAAIDPIRGIAFASIMSVMLWGLLIVAVA